MQFKNIRDGETVSLLSLEMSENIFIITGTSCRSADIETCIAEIRINKNHQTAYRYIEYSVKFFDFPSIMSTVCSACGSLLFWLPPNVKEASRIHMNINFG